MLTVEYRNGYPECSHEGDIAIVSDGALVAATGDPYRRVFLRSSAKPVQVLPLFLMGLDQTYHLKPNEIAVMCASHRAEPEHVEALESILQKTGLREDDLIVKPTYPLGEAARIDAIRGSGARKLYHNCSGKHLNLMLCHRALTGSVDGYHLHETELMERIRTLLRRLSGEEVLEEGTDGCGVPVFRMQLVSLARLYENLADLRRIAALLGEDGKRAVACIHAAVAAHPLLIAGRGRICSILDADPEIFAKGGAKGTYAFGTIRPSYGVALHVEDGAEEPWGIIIREILRRIKPDSPVMAALDAAFPHEIRNDNGEVIGKHLPAFQLKQHN